MNDAHVVTPKDPFEKMTNCESCGHHVGLTGATYGFLTPPGGEYLPYPVHWCNEDCRSDMVYRLGWRVPTPVETQDYLQQWKSNHSGIDTSPDDQLYWEFLLTFAVSVVKYWEPYIQAGMMKGLTRAEAEDVVEQGHADVTWYQGEHVKHRYG